jgi:hypothetical protein
LPDIHLTNIGEKKNGASPAEVFKEVFSVLYGKITSPAVTDVLNKQLKSMDVNIDSLKEGAMKKLEGTTGNVEEKMKDVGKSVKGIFGK